MSTCSFLSTYFPVEKLISLFLPALWPSLVLKKDPKTVNPYWVDGFRRNLTSNVLSLGQE